MQDIDYKSRASTSTALVLLNTRNTEGYQSVSEMLNAGAKGPWGNRISFLHVPIPKLEDSRVWNPLEFVWEAHHIIKRKKQSFAVPLTGMLLDIESKVKGHEVCMGTFGYGKVYDKFALDSLNALLPLHNYHSMYVYDKKKKWS